MNTLLGGFPNETFAQYLVYNDRGRISQLKRRYDCHPKEKKVLARFPLHNFEQITVFGYTGASPALMQKCAEQNIVLNFMTPGGRFMARVIGKQMEMCCSVKNSTDAPMMKRRACFMRKDFSLGKFTIHVGF